MKTISEHLCRTFLFCDWHSLRQLLTKKQPPSAPMRISQLTRPLSVTCSELSPEGYWKRVDTFTSFGWFGKPLALSPLHCARFGWQLRAPDSLVCPHCKRQLIFQNSDPTQLVSYSQLFLELLKSTHTEDCTFRNKSVPAALYAIRSRPSTTLVHGFYERFYALKLSMEDVAQQPTENNDFSLCVELQAIREISVRS